MYPEDLSDEELLDSIMNVCTNIRAYEDAKKLGQYLSEIVSLKVMEDQYKILLQEHD